MSKAKPTLGREYFEALYGADPDPWKFATSDYERRNGHPICPAAGPLQVRARGRMLNRSANRDA
jgi:hypothetical protein